MKKLEVNLSNCYGINSIGANFDYSKCHTNIIYASNGSMKTSLTNTFKKVSLKQSPEEKIHGRIPSCLIEVDSIAINEDSIFVIEPFDEEFSSKSISSLLVNQDMKLEYDSLLEGILDAKNKLTILLNKFSKIKKDDIESALLKDFSVDNIFFLFTEIVEKLDNCEDFSYLQYSTIFDSKVLELLKQESVAVNLKAYIEKYNELIGLMKYYKKGGFNPVRADGVAKTLDKEKYFEAENYIVLNGQEEPIKNAKQLVAKLSEDKDKVINDAELKKISEQISGSVAVVKDFQEILEANPEIALELKDIDQFKRKVWISYLNKNKLQLEECISKFNSGKEKMREIEAKAKIEETRWFEVKEIFKRRFDVPFSIEILDQVNTILGTTNPNIVLRFKDNQTGNEKDFSKEGIQTLKVLSQGERRALYLLYVIFEIESRRIRKNETLFIIDDIADSFDYKNKYAIIEYLKDINDESFFYLLLLTHNFDFFRTIQTRILDCERWQNSFIAVKDVTSIELIRSGSKDTTNPFDVWKKHLHSNTTMLIAAIPFVRNIIEFKEGDKHLDYITLTSLLHIKENPKSNTITLLQLETIFKKYLDKVDFKLGDKENDIVIELIKTNADAIVSVPGKETAEIEIKVALSMAIRLIAEEYMWDRISDKSLITSNQTGKLFDRYKKEFCTDTNEKEKIKTLGSVNLMTPENIHLNSFMYEPILDMSNHHLYDLYKKIKSLN